MKRRIAIAAVLVVPLTLYALTLYPGVGGRRNTGDSAKFQYIGEVLGVPHQPGYPQYVMANYLWTRLPLPMELADRVNLLSAVFALVAGAFLYRFFRELGGGRAIAAVGVWTVLLCRTVWTYSTEAEVYSLHLLWVAAVSWVAARWARDREQRWLVGLFFVYALSFGNHPTMITLLPGLAVLVLSGGRAVMRKRLATAALLAIALSLGQYGYVLWRSYSDAPFVEGIGREADLERLARSVRGDRFASKNLLGQGEEELVARARSVPFEILRQLGPIVLLLAAGGLVAVFRRRHRLRWYLLFGILGPAAFVAAYHVGDWEAYLTPAWVMLAGLAVVAVAGLADRRLLRATLVTLWVLVLAALSLLDFRSLRIEENENDRSLLVAAAGHDAVVVAYRGPGYKSKQLNNYYRYGLHLEEERDLRFLTAHEAFTEDYTWLKNRPLYFVDRKVKRYFDAYRVDYVKRWQSEDPLSHYFVTGVTWPHDRLAVRPGDGGGLQIYASRGQLLTERPGPIEVAVVDGASRRLRGVAPFRFADAWIDDPQRPGLVRFVDRIRGGDWFCMVIQGPTLRLNRATLQRIASQLGFAETPRPQRALVLAGRKGRRATYRAIADPVTDVELALAAIR